MLQHLPAGVGRMLRNMRPGLDELVFTIRAPRRRIALPS